MPLSISNSNSFVSADVIYNRLISKVEFVQTHISQYCLNPGKDFSRKGKWDFKTIFSFLLQFGSKSTVSELCDFFTPEKDQDCGTVPWNSGLIQQRDKLSLDAFTKVLYLFNQELKDLSTINGYIILAHDGSVINIAYDPKDKTSKIVKQGKEISQYHLNALYDCVNHIFMDVAIDTASKTGEKTSLIRMIKDHLYPDNSIITADRGYENYNLMACCIENNQKFVLRIRDKESKSSILAGLALPKGEFDIEANIRLTRKQTKETKSNRNLYKILPKSTTFDYIEEGKNYYGMKFRVVRFKLSTGEYESLVTNLDKEEFSIDDMKELYHLRWEIETAFDKLKNIIGMTNFHSKKRNLIQQEIIMRVILYNLSSAIINNTQLKQKENSKHKKKINFNIGVTNVLKFIKKELNSHQLATRLNQFLTDIRPDRNYPRNVKPGQLKSFNHRVA